VKISLLYNEKAGSAVHADDLRRQIERHGHRVVAMLPPTDEAIAGLVAETELVVVAGGDGTVQRVAIDLAGRGLPLAILPMGTANNIAASLGLHGSFDELIDRWQSDPRVQFDFGLACGPWGERRFVESFGGGLVAHGIVVMDLEAPHEEGPGDMISKALRRFRDVLGDLAARHCRLTLDGETHESKLLLVEVLNIASVGPGLRLAPHAHPSDARFDVVTAGEEHRGEIERYLDDRIAGRPAQLRLPTRHAREVQVRDFDRVHLDDKVLSDLNGHCVSLRVEKSALEILAYRSTDE
jgi:diacylglycerol kinase (ATP)